MATTLTNTTFSTTYKDDFRDSDNYHRILFNTGKALQARELTQIQTFLQNQISRFGNNIYKEGAVVKPGGANLNQKYEFIKLNTAVNTLPTDTSILLGQIFTGTTSSIQVKVLQVVQATGSDPATLYVQYINTVSATAGTTTLRMTAGENMTGAGTALGETLTVQTTNTLANPATGVGILATLKSGIYYARGHFVFTEDQSTIISKYSDVVTTDLGFKAVEDIVTVSDDTDLYDNSGATPDISAPGADRYRIRLTITERKDVDSDENFIHVATIKRGIIYNAISLSDAFNVPNKVLAERIKENSGDYIVKPFISNFQADSANTHLQLRVSDGVVVVEGHRASRSFPTVIRIPKSTTTTTIENEVVPATFGNFVFVNPGTDSATKGIPTLFKQYDLKNDSSHKGTTIGSARVKHVTEDGSKLRFHLFDVQMNAGQAFRNVQSIGDSSTNYFNLDLENNKAVLKDVTGNSSIFALPKPRPQTLTDIQVTVQREFTALSNGAGQASLTPLSVTGETFTNTNDWIVAKTDSDIIPSGLSFTASGGQSMTISGLPTSSSIKVLAYVNKANASVKAKTLETKVQNYLVESDGSGSKFINLRQADVYKVDRVNLLSDSSDIGSKFEIDFAQFPSYYGLAKLRLRPGETAPSTAVQVGYQYFSHSEAGDFFAANSYSGSVDYSKIPSIRLSTGNVIHLRNALDFRSVMDSDGNFTNTSSGARAIEVPQPNTLINADVTYFLGKAGKLVIDTEGVLKFIGGNPGFNPQVPPKPENTLGLYDVYLGANTFDARDTKSVKINHRRFTMKDISQLEKRIDQLEELTSLTLLEHDTKNLQIIDSAGNDRLKAGFVIDNFTDHSLTDASFSRGHRASIDPVRHRARPMFTEDNIKLIYDSAASTNVQKYGDNIYLKFGETPYINQDLATKAITVNPFAASIFQGNLILSPASDEWKDIERINDKVVPGTTRISGVNAYNWDNWSWNWNGESVENLGIGSMTNEISSMVNRVIAEESVLDIIEDKVVQSTLIPYIRARKIFFKAEGLRPNTQHFMFFDGQNMANYVREESTFTRHSDNPLDPGNTLFGKTTHPDTAGVLTSNDNGEIIGSLIIPNNNELKFKTGTREIQLLDISAPNPNNASSVAEANYTAAGTLETRTGTVASSRVLHLMGVKVERRQNLGSTPDGGNPVFDTVYTIPAGTNFYYANDAQATAVTGGVSFSNDAQVTDGMNMAQVDDFSVSFTVDPEISGNFHSMGLEDETVGAGKTSVSNTSTITVGYEPGQVDPGLAAAVQNNSNNYSNNDNNNDDGGYSSDPGGGAGNGSWT